MFQRALSPLPGSGGGGELQQPTMTAATGVTITETQPQDTKIKNYVLSGTISNSVQINVGDTLFTVSNSPKQEFDFNLFLPANGATRIVTLKTDGRAILKDYYMAAGFTWEIRTTKSDVEYLG